MDDKSPLLFLLQLALTVGIIFLMIYLVIKVSMFLHELRDELRDHYIGTKWTPQRHDLVLIPLWMILEVVCLMLIIAWALIVMWLVKSSATAFRDWWHAGAKCKR